MSYPHRRPPVYPPGPQVGARGNDPSWPVDGRSAPGPPTGERRSAPAPVLLVAAVQMLGGTVAVLSAGWIALAMLGGPAYTDGINLPPGVPQLLERAGGPVGVGLAVGGLVAIGLGRKLQRGRQWARILLLILCALMLTTTLYVGIFGAGHPNALLGVVLPVLVLYALNTGAVRSWFRSGGS